MADFELYNVPLLLAIVDYSVLMYMHLFVYSSHGGPSITRDGRVCGG